jgi:uncharacterized Zn-finger protein
VRAQGAAVGEADEHVLAARHHLDDGGAGEVDRGQLGDPELAAGQRRAVQRGVHPLRCQPDGVSLGHVAILPGGEVVCPAV